MKAGGSDSSIVLVAALSFCLLFQAWFYRATLYNSASDADHRVKRSDLLLMALPSDRPGSPNLLSAAWRHLVEPGEWRSRGPLVATQAMVLVAALLLGDIIRRGFGPSSSLLERVTDSFGLGMASISLMTQWLGLAGLLRREAVAGIAITIVISWLALAPRRAPSAQASTTANSTPGILLKAVLALVMTMFAGLSLAAALLPTTDYDALGYHLLAPKEWFQSGRISFLEHNVYASFPFLTEMFTLLAMVARRDWFEGGLVGQAILWSFGPMTAAAIALATRRSFGSKAGWLAAAIYLSTPWTYRLSSIPYVEGALLFYTILAIDAAGRDTSRSSILAGVFAGSAIGCKYPAVLMTVLPAMAWMWFSTSKVHRGRATTWFFVSAVFASATWLIRNLVWTGNPVFPLLYDWIGGQPWSDELQRRFALAHRSNDFRWATLVPYAIDVLGRSDWQSAVIFAFAPLAILGAARRTAIAWWLLVVLEYLVYWGLTHRLDRFWLPLEPLAAALAGAGAVWSERLSWRIVAGASLSLAFLFNAIDVTSGLCGPAHYSVDVRKQSQANIRSLWPAIASLNDERLIPRDSRVLVVGFAGLYDAVPAVRYNTVFNENLLERWVDESAADPVRGAPARPFKRLLKKLRQEGITHVLVDWTWIDRYRAPGNYGFTPFITHELVDELTHQGILIPQASARDAQGRPSLELFAVAARPKPD